MKIPSTTFLCDTSKCAEKITVMEGEDSPTAAYLALVERGWMVKRLYMGWKHHCPTHYAEASA